MKKIPFFILFLLIFVSVSSCKDNANIPANPPGDETGDPDSGGELPDNPDDAGDTPNVPSGTKQYHTANVKTKGTAEITRAFGYNESIYIHLTKKSNITYKAYYKENSQTTYSEVSTMLISNDEINIVGLKGGKTYDVKITSMINNIDDLTPTIFSVYVNSYDRSGYAHFNYTDGIGGYNDDGSLKNDAIVLYVTEENKDTITVPGFSNCGTGIGYILNNNETNLKKITKRNSLVVRFIGKITNPKGTTAYNSTENGGSVKDNGCMARIKGGKNITLEGIGTTSMIHGWGFHFIATAGSYADGYGKSFEVRNLTFDDYPEDALGMEGEQSGSNLTSPVERCFVHHNTFLSGYCANPAESDKADGDGSCDFKRGQYYTLSYNKFKDCHKTNLIGSGGESLQYNVTMHHNLWNGCRSRAPLSRQANIHMYNNYFVNTADYAMNVRANAYIFSEANYFEKVKRPYSLTKENPGNGIKVGGVIKAYNDVLDNVILDATYSAVKVSRRDEQVENNNKYNHFDTNNSIFYYDSVNKKTKVSLLTDANEAKKDCLSYSGTMRYDGVELEDSEEKK